MPDNVVDLIMQGSADNIATNNVTNLDRVSLVALKALIDQKLAAYGASPAVEESKEATPALVTSGPPTPSVATPAAEDPVVEMNHDKVVDTVMDFEEVVGGEDVDAMSEEIVSEKEIVGDKQPENVEKELAHIQNVEGDKDVEMTG
jgi:hypothetical protein